MRGALMLALAVALARAAYLVFACPYTLVEDEAHYRQWAERPDLAYYSKGPGIALLLRAVTQSLGESEAALRMGSVLAGLVASAALAALTRDLAPGVRRGPLAAVSLFSVVPHFFPTALVATTDMPHLACWSVAALAGWRAVRAGGWWWAGFALALAVGLLFRWTILALGAGLVVHACLRGKALASIVALATSLAGLVPTVLWNIREGWPTWKHHLGHLGARGGDMPPVAWSYDPRWTLEFVGSQAALAGPVLVLAVMGVRAMLRGTGREAGAFTLLTSLPILLFYLLVSVRTDVEATWGTPGFVTLIPAAVVASAGRRGLLVASVVYGAVGGAAVLRMDLLARAIPNVVSVRRFLGADAAAEGIGRLAREAEASSGTSTFFIAKHYGRASLAWYYLPGRPTVRCASRFLGGRACQQDHWADHDLNDPSLVGRSAVLIGGESAEWASAFERVVGPVAIPGPHKLGEVIFIGYGFKGAGAWGG